VATKPSEMTGADFAWAAELMQRRRECYASYSPVFWRPAQGVVALHARFLQYGATRPGAVALRSEYGFIITRPAEGRCFVDDFAVEDDSAWPVEGHALLHAAWQRVRSPEQSSVRVVSARRDEPKRDLMIALGLSVISRWWVKALTPTGPAQPHGPLTLGDVAAFLVAAPPVYDPGGPVCLLGDLEPARAAVAAERAAQAGAVLVIVQREGGDIAVASAEPELEAAGFHNPAEFYQGQL